MGPGELASTVAGMALCIIVNDFVRRILWNELKRLNVYWYYLLNFSLISYVCYNAKMLFSFILFD